MNAEISRFDRKEEQFNSRYNESLSRNLFKEYETGFLDKCQEKYREEREKTEKDLDACNKKIEVGEEKEADLSDEISENKRKLRETGYELKDAGKELAAYDSQLEEREKKLRFFGLQGQDLFDTDCIISLCEHKLHSIQEIRDQLRDEVKKLKKEQKKLNTNPSMELPPELEEALITAGVDYCYGMEWLRKNGRSAEKNRKMIESHPFLPYALT